MDPLFRLDVLGRMRLRALGAQPAGSWFSGEADTPQLFVGQTDVMAGAPFGIMHGGSWRFLLRSDGKIGIGTTTPSELLDVAGNLKISAGGKLFFPDGTSLSTAATGGVTNVTSTDPAIVVTKSGTTSQLSLANLGIGTSKLADASITTSKLADASVTPAKFSSTLSPTMITGVAATLGSNQFVGSQSVQGPLTVAGQLQVQDTASTGRLTVVINGPINNAITARNTGSTDSAVAIRAESESTAGTAVSAVATSTIGTAVAVNARTNAPLGQGVYGEASSPTGNNFGVRGASRSSQGVGVQGEALGPTGPNFGVVGITSSANGSAAMYAENNATYTTSASYGIYAKNQASTGVGIYGYEAHLSGATYGIYGRADSPNGVAGMFMLSASSGNILAANNASRRVFRVDTTGTVYAFGAFSPGGADYAESVAITGVRSDFRPGDVLVISSDSDRSFSLSEQPYSTNVAGVFSTKPGVLGSTHPLEPAADEVPLAMIGIVPCHVTAENGPIHRGDLLVTSTRVGYAMRGTDRSLMLGAVVGKALQPLESGEGEIEILVTLQ